MRQFDKNDFPRCDFQIELEGVGKRAAPFNGGRSEKNYYDYFISFLAREEELGFRYCELVLNPAVFQDDRDFDRCLLGLADALETAFERFRIHVVVLLKSPYLADGAVDGSVSKVLDRFIIKDFLKGLIIPFRDDTMSAAASLCKETGLALVVENIATFPNLENVSRLASGPSILYGDHDLEPLYKIRCPLLITVDETDAARFDDMFPPSVLQRLLHSGLCLNFSYAGQRDLAGAQDIFNLSRGAHRIPPVDLFSLLRNGIEASFLEEDEKFIFYKELNAYLEPEEEFPA